MLKRLARRSWSPPARAFAGTFAFMLAIGSLGLIPLVGPLVDLGTALVGLGAVLLTRFGTSEFVPAPAE